MAVARFALAPKRSKFSIVKIQVQSSTSTKTTVANAEATLEKKEEEERSIFALMCNLTAGTTTLIAFGV